MGSMIAMDGSMEGDKCKNQSSGIGAQSHGLLDANAVDDTCITSDVRYKLVAMTALVTTHRTQRSTHLSEKNM